ncbi:MAG TPA: thioredoxin fold domain-containing protein [Verrucomicrobiae bacterium]|nr:thioredoxin fold domain-containing protein [Verrucomicrobiae bacterium]
MRCTALAPGCNRIEDGEVKIPRLFLVAAAVSLFFAAFARAESDWLHDYNKAQEEAKTNHKLLFLNFTGSDWCGWCIRLDKDIFSQPKFKDYAHDNLVLVELDFPRRKSQPTEERKQNMQLAQQYEVLGFPTIVVLNSNGQKVWKFDGYFPGGPEAFIEQLQKLPKG